MAVYELRGIDDTLRDILNTLKSGIATASTGPSSVTIIGDYVGLARDSTLQSVLSQLRSALTVTGSVGILGQPISVSPSGVFPITGGVGISADYVGLARDSTAQSILSQLRSVLSVTGSVGILGQPIAVSPSTTFPISGTVGVSADYVGLARDSTLQSILSQLRSVLYVTGSVGILGQPITVSPASTFPISGSVGIIADYVGLARDSSLQSILNQLKTYVAVTGSVSILGQPISVYPSTTFPVSGTVGIAADFVGLARDSSLQSILSQLKSTLSVTGSVGILGQPISVSPSGTFPVSGTIGIIADNVGLARDSTLQSILSQLRSTLATTGTIGIIADYVGLARDSTVASTKLRGGTLNVSSITMNPNTAYTLIGSNSNRISVAVLNSGAGTLYIGPSTTSLIWPLYPGQTIVLNYINALYGQTTATGTVVIMELAY